MLEAKSLKKCYGTNVVLKDVSVNVRPGAVTVVMGPSGGGKSTLVRLMSLLETPDGGGIFLDGKRLSSSFNECPTQKEAPWPEITVVFQQLFLWPHMTLAKNIRLPAELRHLSLNKYKEFIEILDIANIVNRYPNQVSIGQRQRAALIRALLLQPRFLLLDEITSALDVEQISALVTVLTDCLKRNVGLMIVTHHLGFAGTLLSYRDAGEFIFLERGEVIETGGSNTFISPVTKRVQGFLATIRSVS